MVINIITLGPKLGVKQMNKLKGFLQRILQEMMEKKTILGTSDAWSTIHLDHRPSELAYCKLTDFLTTQNNGLIHYYNFPEKLTL